MNKFYFFNLDGMEIKTDLSGADFASCGAAIAVETPMGYYKKGYETKEGYLYARDRIYYFNRPGTFEESKITIDDFPGHELIMVQDWSWNETEWFILTRRHESEKMADDVDLVSITHGPDGDKFDY